MSKENIDLVQGFYNAAAKGDFGGAGLLLDRDVEWIEPEVPGLWFSGTHRGPGAVFKEVIEPSFEKFDQFRVDRDQFLDAGDQVVVTGAFRGRNRSTGADFKAPFVHIWKVEGGKVTQFQNFVDTATMLNALGTMVPQHGMPTA